MWYCDICDRTINIQTKSKQINSNSHKHNEKNCVVVKEYQFDNPNNNELFSVIDKCAR